MYIARMTKRLLSGMLMLCSSTIALWGATSAKPKLTDTLNDFNPEYPIGIYIQELSSNEVTKVVSLTNGVLSVGENSISFIQPTHDVIETNFIYDVSGVITNITTNTYSIVYEDGLRNTLNREFEQFATKSNLVAIADEITDPRLTTLNGIVEILQSIKTITTNFVSHEETVP